MDRTACRTLAETAPASIMAFASMDVCVQVTTVVFLLGPTASRRDGCSCIRPSTLHLSCDNKGTLLEVTPVAESTPKTAMREKVQHCSYRISRESRAHSKVQLAGYYRTRPTRSNAALSHQCHKLIHHHRSRSATRHPTTPFPRPTSLSIPYPPSLGSIHDALVPRSLCSRRLRLEFWKHARVRNSFVGRHTASDDTHPADTWGISPARCPGPTSCADSAKATCQRLPNFPLSRG